MEPKPGETQSGRQAGSAAGDWMQKRSSSPTLQAPPITGKGGPEPDAESAGAAPSSTNQDEVRRAFRRN